MPDKPGRHRYMLRGIVAAIACICVLLTLTVPKIQEAREAARRSACTGRFCGISTALRNYESRFGRLPPAVTPDASGEPAHSWRALLLPYLECDTYDLTEPWNGSNNRKLATDRIIAEVFQCPSSGSEGTALTDYVAIIGEHTAFPRGRSISLSDIRDGENTILVVEIARSDIPWMEPRDLEFAAMSFRINDGSRPSVSSLHPGGAVVSMHGYCGGRFISDRVPPADVRALITIDGGEMVREAGR